MGRFINADEYTSTGQGILGNNMFAYCGNNPVLGFDPYGAFDLVGAAVSMTSYALSSGGDINVGEMLVAGTVGGISGIAASVSVAGAFVAGGITGLYTFCTSEGTLEERVGSAVIAAMATTAGGALAFTGCAKLLEGIKATADAAYFIGSVGINYSVGQVADLASVGLQTLNKLPSQSTSTQSSSPSTKSSATTEAYRRKTWDIIQNIV